jgi:hypothetical protein
MLSTQKEHIGTGRNFCLKQNAPVFSTWPSACSLIGCRGTSSVSASDCDNLHVVASQSPAAECLGQLSARAAGKTDGPGVLHAASETLGPVGWMSQGTTVEKRS